MRRSLLLILWLAATALPAAGAERVIYEEPFEPPSGASTMFGGQLLFGPSGPWIGALKDGGYQLKNDSDPGGVYYLYIDQFGDFDLTSATVSVTASGRFESELAAVGLTYRFDARDRSYLAFTVTNDGYVVWQRTANGFKHLAAGPHAAILPDKPNLLAVSRQGGSLSFSVNGQDVVSVPNEHGSGPGIGLFVVGLGEFQFDDFAVALP